MATLDDATAKPFSIILVIIYVGLIIKISGLHASRQKPCEVRQGGMRTPHVPSIEWF